MVCAVVRGCVRCVCGGRAGTCGAPSAAHAVGAVAGPQHGSCPGGAARHAHTMHSVCVGHAARACVVGPLTAPATCTHAGDGLGELNKALARTLKALKAGEGAKKGSPAAGPAATEVYKPVAAVAPAPEAHGAGAGLAALRADAGAAEGGSGAGGEGRCPAALCSRAGHAVGCVGAGVCGAERLCMPWCAPPPRSPQCTRVRDSKTGSMFTNATALNSILGLPCLTCMLQGRTQKKSSSQSPWALWTLQTRGCWI